MRQARFLAIVAIASLGSISSWAQPSSAALAPKQASSTFTSRASAAHLLSSSQKTPRAAGATQPWRVTATPYLVLLVLDGARPDYFTVPGIPHIRALIDNGTQYKNAWSGILESETPSGHATIGTGSEPRQDGIASFSWATSDNLSVNLFDPSVIRRGAMENILTQAHVPTIAGLVHKRDPTAKVVALSGHKYYAADAIGGPQADVIMYYSGTPSGTFAPTSIPGHVPPVGILTRPHLTVNTTHLPVGLEDHLAMRLAIATFRRMHQRVTLINVPEFDWPLGHVDGGDLDRAVVRSLMQGFDRDLGQLENAYSKAGVLDRTLFVLTADHGMAPVYYRVQDSIISKAVAAAGTRIIQQTYHTASYIWVNNQSRLAAAAAHIARLRNPYIQSVYYKTWLGKQRGFAYVRATDAGLLRAPGAENANQYLLHTFIGPNGPDIAVFFTEDAASEPGGQWQWKGDHGGAAWQSQHVPLIFSGPGVRRGYVSVYPARLMDIAPTALSLMGVASTGMAGIPLADAIQAPPASATAAQHTQSKYLWPVISALRAESQLEVKARL